MSERNAPILFNQSTNTALINTLFLSLKTHKALLHLVISPPCCTPSNNRGNNHKTEIVAAPFHGLHTVSNP